MAPCDHGMQLEHAEGEVQALQDTCDAVTKRVALAENESAVFKQQHAELKEQLREVRTACRCAVGRAMRLGGANHDRFLWCRVFVLRLAWARWCCAGARHERDATSEPGTRGCTAEGRGRGHAPDP